MGWIDLSRRHLAGISPASRDSVQPLDDRLGLTDRLTEAARRLLNLAGGSWSFDTASRHPKEFCGLDASDEFLRRVAEAGGKELAVRMDDAPEATEAFEKAAGDAEFETDGTAVDTTEGWKEAKIGTFAKRARGESVETKRWADRTLPAPAARFAFAGIAESVAFAPRWVRRRRGGASIRGPGRSRFWRTARSGFGTGPTSNSPARRRCWTSSTP